MADLKLPDSMIGHVRKCGWCDGKGEYEQSYNYGCGLGRFKSMGPCQCRYDGAPGYLNGCGFVYEDGSHIPISVYNHIVVFNQRLEAAILAELKELALSHLTGDLK
jgi:hypothetical protein